jgi:hypothetical protein
MIPVPAGVRVWLATGHTDMRNYAQPTVMLSGRAWTAEAPRFSTA